MNALIYKLKLTLFTILHIRNEEKCVIVKSDDRGEKTYYL